jgi:hypothetical protein
MSQHDRETRTDRAIAEINVERRIAADPASAVLLLTSPASAELWPGVALESAEPGDHIKLRVVLPPDAAAFVGIAQPITADVRAEPPQRTPTSFVTRFSFVAPMVPNTSGTLTLTYTHADDTDGSATIARLVFAVASEPFATPEFLTALERSAKTFLDHLAAAAEERSHAA